MISVAYIHQSGVLPYQRQDDALRLLLITSQTTKSWIVPKGHIEPGLTARESAEMEAFEEAGIAGTIGGRALGSYTYQRNLAKGGDWCRVRVFPMEVERIFDEFPEVLTRERRWVPPE